jgi:hypothetical protein
MTLKQIGSRGFAIILSALLCNAPQYLAAQSASPAAQTQQATENQNLPSQNAQQTTTQPASGSAPPDPAQAPLTPVPSARPAESNSVPPDAPSEVQKSQQTQIASPTADTQPTKQQPSVPLGTATAQQGATRGGLASKPAGEAIAPAKQRQVHSLLIKVGLLAAGAAAVGTVVGLTRGTSSIPPGAK